MGQHPQAEFTRQDIKDIRKILFDEDITIKELSRRIGITYHQLYNPFNRKCGISHEAYAKVKAFIKLYFKKKKKQTNRSL